MNIVQTWTCASDEADIIVAELVLSDKSTVYNVYSFNDAHYHLLVHAFNKSHAIECAEKIVAACLAAA